MEAFQEVCRRRQIEWDSTSLKDWQEIQERRPDLVTEAHHLADDPDFVVPIVDRVGVRTDHYMQRINVESLGEAISIGLKLFLIRETEQVRDDVDYILERPRRLAKSRQQHMVNEVRKFTAAGDTNRRERPPQKKGWAFNYQQLCNVVCKLGSDSPPLQKDVARKLGCTNLHRILASHEIQLTKVHGHSDYRWKVLAQEIWDRCRKKV